MDCEWVIRGAPNEKIRLTFTALSLERSRNCRFDFVEVLLFVYRLSQLQNSLLLTSRQLEKIREGGTPQSPLIGRYCAQNIPLPILSQGNQLFVRFRSDYSVASSGFRARYETGTVFLDKSLRKKSNLICHFNFFFQVCGGAWSASSGMIQSPNYPAPYPSNKECIYVIGLDPGKAVRLDFLNFDVEGSADCRFDYLEVHRSITL